MSIKCIFVALGFKKIAMPFYYNFFLLLILLLVSCSPSEPTNNSTVSAEEVWQNMPLKHATNFTIQKKGNYTLLKILSPWKGADSDKEYLLYPKSEKKPLEYPNAIKIATPVERIICTSTVDIAFLDALGATNKIVAISNGDYVYNPTIRQALQEKSIVEIGGNNTIDYEKALVTNPDLAFIYSISATNNYKKFEALGIPTVFLSDFMEQSPLGRTEWLFFIAHFLELEDQAAVLFDNIEHHYQTIKQKALIKEKKPTVLTGAVYEGTWYVAGGNSLMAQLIADAGGDYLWADNTELSGVPFDFEAVYPKALEADCWINMSSYTTKKDLLAGDQRYQAFQTIQTNRLFNYFKRSTPNGGTDIFESAIVHPERILKDLSLIFNQEHPSPERLFYYQQLQ